MLSILVAILGCILVLMLFGPGNRGILGKIYTVFGDILTRFWTVLDHGLEICRLKSFCKRFDWIMNDKHPLVQIFYLFLMFGALLVFLITIYLHIPNTHVSALHIYVAPIIIILPYIAFAVASTSDPGIIHSKNVDKAQCLWDYDYILFSPKECSTCKLIKPARSKHCSVCKACIAVCDHHCIWINNCVGYRNYRYFLLFLTTTAIYCFYFGLLGYQTIKFKIDSQNLRDMYVMVANNPVKLQGLTLWYQVFSLYPLLSALSIFAVFSFLLVFAFFLHCIYLTLVCGMTTNESFKWDDIDYSLSIEPIEIDSDVLEFNKNKKSVNFLETRKEPTKVKITSRKQLRNVYNDGIWNNLMTIIFPAPM